jgi:hypothetical protein
VDDFDRDASKLAKHFRFKKNFVHFAFEKNIIKWKELKKTSNKYYRTVDEPHQRINVTRR